MGKTRILELFGNFIAVIKKMNRFAHFRGSQRQSEKKEDEKKEEEKKEEEKEKKKRKKKKRKKKRKRKKGRRKKGKRKKGRRRKGRRNRWGIEVKMKINTIMIKSTDILIDSLEGSSSGPYPIGQ